MPLAGGPFGGREANWDRRRNPSHANTGAATRRESQGASANLPWGAEVEAEPL